MVNSEKMSVLKNDRLFREYKFIEFKNGVKRVYNAIKEAYGV